MLSVLTTYIDIHSHIHTNNNQNNKKVGGTFEREWMWFFGLDSGDGFTGVYLFPNSWNCINYMCTALTYHSHLDKMVKK